MVYTNERELCLKLARCETEGAVKKILEQEGFWEKPSAWRDLGDIKNNFGIVGDQQDSADTALVEKITNSVDAVLTAECWLAGINPEDSEKSPPTMLEAVERFFDITGGKLSEITPDRRTKLAANINLVATGNKQNPSIAIIDKGEGQSPERMPETLLSLLKSNKVRVPFVQGIYNMGGSGALRFCSETHNLQLIISRRHPEIAKHEREALKHKWSFTVVRRFDPIEGDRVSKYRYLAPTNNELLTFESDGLPLLPGKSPEAYSELLPWGTYIKLYQYQLRKFSTKITLDLYYRLSFLLPAIGLPIRIYERREAFGGHTPESTLSGLTVRLEEDSRKSDSDPKKNLEKGFPFSSAVTLHGQTMPALIYVFKKGQHKHYKKDEGIVFTVNGQTHGYIHKSFFDKDTVKLPYLRDSIVVMVDCSGSDRRTRERLVLTSRDRLADLPLKHEIERAVADLLYNHRGLRELQRRRLDEEISNKLKDSKPLEDILRDILSKDYALETVLIHGGRLPNPKKIEASKAAKEFNGKQFPTYFSLCKEDYSAERPKLAQQNARFRIQYKTDAANNYFYRDVEPGTFTLSLDGQEVPSYSVNLWNGIATLNTALPKSCSVGDILHFESLVTDNSRIDPFTHEFYVKAEPKEKKSSSASGRRRPPASNAEGNNSKKPSSLAAPKIIPVREAEWRDQEPEFTKESAASVVETPDSGYLFKVNFDNVYLRKHMQKSNTDPKILEARFTIGMVLTGLGLLNRYRRRSKDESTEEFDIYKTVREVTEAMSLVLLPMIDRLAELKETVLAISRESDMELSPLEES